MNNCSFGQCLRALTAPFFSQFLFHNFIIFLTPMEKLLPHNVNANSVVRYFALQEIPDTLTF